MPESNPPILRAVSQNLEQLKQTIFAVCVSNRDADLLWRAYQEVADAYQELRRLYIGIYNKPQGSQDVDVNAKLLANLRWVYDRLASGEAIEPGDPWFAMARDAIAEAQAKRKA